MVCFPVRGTNICVLDATGSSGRGLLVAEGRSRRGVVRSSLALLPPIIREMSWTHRGRAVCTAPGPGPTAGVPGATTPSWEGQRTAAPFLLLHDFPGSVCADEPGLPAPSPLSLSIPFLPFSRTMGLLANCKCQVHCERPHVVNPQSHLTTRGLSRGLNIYYLWSWNRQQWESTPSPHPCLPRQWGTGLRF